MDYDDIDKVVFASESARRASVGAIPEHAHWAEVLKRLKHPISEMKSFQDEFFGGDVIDRDLVEYIRSLRGKVHTGLISNAWSGLREFIAREKVIYQVALEQARVKAEEAVFVDDVNINLEGCEDLGMTGILFKNPQDSIAELKRLLEEHT